MAISKKSMVWLGGCDERVQGDFDALFARKLCCTGDVFLNATPEEIASEHRRRAAVQRNFFPPDMDVMAALAEDASLLQNSCMSPGMHNNFCSGSATTRREEWTMSHSLSTWTTT